MLLAYDDCCVWSHAVKPPVWQRAVGRGHKLADQGREQARLRPDEVLAAHEDNWRVETADIVHGYYSEFTDGEPFLAGMFSPTSGLLSPTYPKARLELELRDGSLRTIVFGRREGEEHAVAQFAQRWLGDRYVAGDAPGRRGLLRRLRRH